MKLNPFRWLERKENPAYRAIISLGLSGPKWTNADYGTLAQEGFIGNSDVYSCIKLHTTAAKGVPWKAFRRTRAGEPKELDSMHPLAKLLRRPNPRQGWGGFMEATTGYFNIAGNSYITRVGPDNRPPLELWSLRPDRMRVVVGTPFNPIEGYDYYAGSACVQMRQDAFGQTCLHLKNFHPTDDWYGLSPLQVASRNIDQSNAWQAWNVALGQNMARPSGALVSEGGLGDEQFERLKAQINDTYSGFANAGRPMLLEAGLKWQAVGLSPADADWLNGDERTTRKICAAFGVSPELLGMMSKGGMNDSNFAQARKRLYLDTVLPYLDGVKDELNNWLAPMYGDDIFLDYLRDEIEAIQEDRDIVYNRAIKAWSAGLIRMNEGRKMIGLEPDETYGEVYFSKSNLVGEHAEAHAEQRAAVNEIVQPADQQQQPGKLPGAKPGKQPKKAVENTEHPLLTAAREFTEIL